MVDVWCLLSVALALSLLVTPSYAQAIGTPGAGGVPDTSVASPESSGQPSAAATPSIQSSLGKYGDPGGIRALLDTKGIDYSFAYTSEVLGNISGGVKRGATFEGRFDGQLDVDLEKLSGAKGAALHASFFEIQGRGLSGNNLFDLLTVSNIEAFPVTRLYEAWVEQKLADGKLALRVGQLAADTEFLVSQTATLFIGSTFGFPTSITDNLPSGGPDYPLATPGFRLKVTPSQDVTLLAALFDGDPAGPYVPGRNQILPQLRDASGTNFRVQDPPLLIAEAQYAYNQSTGAKGLPGTIKVGYLHHFGTFADTTKPNLAGALSGNDGVYGIIDQTIYRESGAKSQQGAAVFLRLVGMPGDRNLVDLYVDGGVAYQGFLANRPDDTFGVSAAYARVSPYLSRQDQVAGTPLVRDFQALIEVSYQIVVSPGFTIQPDFQYVFHPGAHGVADPLSGLPAGNAAVFGLRAALHY